MNPLHAYFQSLRDIRATGGGVKEESYYGTLETLLNSIGQQLQPQVRCVIQLQNRGAGKPDGGLFTRDQFQSAGDREPQTGALPSRGVLEVKSAGEDAWFAADFHRIMMIVGSTLENYCRNSMSNRTSIMTQHRSNTHHSRIVQPILQRIEDMANDIGNSITQPKLLRLMLLRMFDPGFVFFFYLMISDTRTFLQNTRYALDAEKPQDIADLRRIYRRIVLGAATVLVIGCLVVPFSAPCLAVWLRGIIAPDAVFRMILGVFISMALLPLYLPAAASVGCLTAPSRFLSSPAGKKWMVMLGGTKNLLMHRIFCVLCALTGFGVMAGVGAMLMYMASPKM